MTQQAKKPLWLNLLLALLILIGAAVIWLQLAGAIFLMLAKEKTEAGFLTFYQYWFYYRHIPVISNKLNLAAMISGAIVMVPLILIFMPKRKKQHGDARFANSSEIRQAGLLGERGLIIGKWRKKFLMYSGPAHALMAAPTRSGKGISVVVPNCLSWPESLVVLDIKQEAFDLTSGYRAKHGQQVFLFNPAARDYKTHRWNPLSYISDDPNFRIDDIQKIAGFLFPDMDGEDPIWTSSARSLFLGTVLYLIETPGKPITLGEVLRTVTGPKEAGAMFKDILKKRVETGKPLSRACSGALNDFISTSENTRTSIRKTFSSRFELLHNPLIDAATSGNDFDLREIRKKRMTLYVGVTPDNLERMAPLLNLFFQQLLDMNTQELPLKNPSLKYKCLLLLDEFTAMGKIPALSKGVSYVAGYGLVLLPVIQSHAQLRDVYGHDSAENFSINLGLQIEFAPRDNQRAEEISKALGNQTWRVRSWSNSSGGKSSSTTSKSDQARPLMLPQEVKEIGTRKQFIFMENVKPIFCDKVHYFLEPVFVDRLKEISPSLAALGKELPTKDQLEAAAGNGELAATVPLIRVDLPTLAELQEIDLQEEAGTVERTITAADMDTLDDLKLEDFSCDFSDISFPDDPATDEQLQSSVDDLLSRFGMTA